jgi:peroxiredoxin
MFDICPLKVGEEIPEASLMDQNGEATSLASIITEKPTVLIFYCGAWCGYCTRHLAELNDLKSDIADLAYQIFGITADQSSKTEESTKKSGGEITVYSDAKLEAITAFGLNCQLDDEQFHKKNRRPARS